MDPILAAFLIAVLIVLSVHGIAKHRADLHRKSVEPPKPICGCDHSYGLHTEEGCQYVKHDRVKIKDRSTETETPFGTDIVNDVEWQVIEKRCGCRRYVGPVPLESVWTPPMIGGL